jgi:hypothetical protein
MYKKTQQSLVLFLCLWVHISNAATIRVPQEQPTIQAGIDAAESEQPPLSA